MNQQCDIIILAAGASSRLGKPKQLLAYKESSFLQNSIAVALASLAQRVVVVLGANAAAIQPALANDRLHYIINEDWEEGIAASIRCGLQYLQQQTPAPQNLLYMVCDQPYISSEVLNKLITLQRQTGHAIVASKYAGTTGIPVIFAEKFFPGLLQLKGDAGAKKMIQQQKEEVATVSFPLGEIDIDTEADYQDLQKSKQEE